MKRMLRRPVTNAIGIGVFTAFYALVFLLRLNGARFAELPAANGSTQEAGAFWGWWQRFLVAGHHAYIAYAMIALTVLVVILLMKRSHPYDEYHTSLLMACLAVASVLTLIAIAAFFLMILSDPSMAAAKFTLFIVVNWSTVVLADLVFVFLCRWK